MVGARGQLIFWVSLFALSLIFLVTVSDILLPFVVGILAAYFLDPAADRLELWGFSRTAATATITAIFFLLVISVSLLLLPVLYDQFIALARNIPVYVESFQKNSAPYIERVLSLFPENDPQQVEKAATGLSGYILKAAGALVKDVVQSSAALLSLLSLIFISPVVSFYLLRDWDKMVAKIDELLPREYAATIRAQIREINHTLAGYIRGQSNVCLLLGTMYAIGLSLIGLEFGLFIGFFTGLLAFIPYVGLLIGMVTGVAVAFFQFGDVPHIAAVLAVFVTGQILEGNFLTPRLVGEKVGLHAVWIIFGLLAGGSLFGFTGVLLAVPVTAVIGVLVRFMVSQYRNGSLYKGRRKKPVTRKKVSAGKKAKA